MKPQPASRANIKTVCALTLLGCAAGTASAYEPCKLLTQEQVSAAVGMSVAPGNPIDTTGCDWGGPTGSRLRVTLSLWPGSGWEKMKTPAPGFTKTPVSGLGDDAFYTLIGPFGSLSVKKGDTVFIVRIYGIPDTDKQLAIDKSLAHEVIARM